MKSQRLRSDDLVRIYRLLGECRDLGHDSVLWRAHMLESLSVWLGAREGTSMEIRGCLGAAPELVADIGVGWPDARAKEFRERYLVEHGVPSDPMWPALMRRYEAAPGVLAAFTSELVRRADWEGSEHFNEYRKPAGADRSLYGLFPLRGPECVLGMSLTRGLGEPDFKARDRDVCRWLLHELRPLVGRQLAAPGEPSVTALPPRLRQLLRCLLEGDSEKEAALRLGLSVATVHQYVTALYRHYGVASRGQLLARWLRFDRGNA